MAVFGMGQSFAQLDPDEMGFFNHVSIGVSAGTDGIGIDLGAPLGTHFATRVGVSFFPSVKYKFDVNAGSNNAGIFVKDKVDLEGKLDMTNFKLLFDYYPSLNSSFRITAGAFIGADKIISVYNDGPFIANPAYYGTAGVKLGDYRITSDAQGNVSADLKVNKFKPYLGIGFGRAVPRKRIGLAFDLGVQFWGSPGVYTTTKDDFGDTHYKKLGKDDTGNDDANNVFDILSKVTVYPVMSLRLCGRIL